MTKVAIACIGKFKHGSGAEKVWAENLIFRPNVVASVLVEQIMYAH